MRLWIASSILLSISLLVVVPGQAQQELSLDQMLQRFARLPGLSASFQEEKRIALLAVPVRSQGEIHFAPPGKLLRRVTSPTESAALIADGRITMVGGGRRQEIDLSDNPVVAGFVDSFRHVLAGDRAALERTYRVTFRQLDSQGWELTLRPRTEQLRQFLQEMKLKGRGIEVESMSMTEVSGDVTETTFSNIRTHSWSDAEAVRTFRL